MWVFDSFRDSQELSFLKEGYHIYRRRGYQTLTLLVPVFCFVFFSPSSTVMVIFK